MKPRKYAAGIIACMIALALWVSPWPANGDPGKGKGNRGGHFGNNVKSQQPAPPTDQWIADPERGWIRAEERPESRPKESQAKPPKRGKKNRANNGQGH